MLSFKDAIADDIGGTFADVNEFFKESTVDGKQMRICQDALDVDPYKGSPSKGEHLDGIYQGNSTVYIPEADYGAMPKPGKPIIIDGKHYIIQTCSSEDGMYCMIIRRNRQ